LFIGVEPLVISEEFFCSPGLSRWVTDSFRIVGEEKMYVNSEVLAPKENKQKRLVTHVNQPVKIGDQRNCPECTSIGSVVWISQDKKTMGVRCHKSHREAERPSSKFGPTRVVSTKTRKNVVFLTAAA
jgi:hypothetical protein